MPSAEPDAQSAVGVSSLASARRNVVCLHERRAAQHQRPGSAESARRFASPQRVAHSAADGRVHHERIHGVQRHAAVVSISADFRFRADT